MSNSYVYICIVLMAVVTEIIRLSPLVLLRKGIKNKFFRSFLYYAPYVTLAVLTFPAIIYCTGNETTAIIGFIAAIITAFISESLPVTAAISCAIVFIAQLIF